MALWSHKRRFPSLFLIYDQKGNEILRYAHTGRLEFYCVGFLEKNNKVILLGGTNNLLGGDAVLVCLDCSQLRSGLGPPYTAPPDLTDEDWIMKYIPMKPVRAFQKYYLRFKHNELSKSLGIKWLNILEVSAGKNEIMVLVNFGLRKVNPVFFSFDSYFNLRYISPGAETERDYERFLEEGKIHIPLDDL